jgi:outer membrane receptor protein involved in Fe transport
VIRIIPLLFFLFVLLCATGLRAQKGGGIYGSVRSSGNQPIEGATIILLKTNDSSGVRTLVTDKKGGFVFDGLKKGTYFLKITAIGYQEYKGPDIEHRADDSRESIGVIVLSDLVKEMKEAVVVTRKPLVENKIDKMVVNVDASTTNTGLSALEVLERSPGVTVDNDGNVSLKGKQGVVILIDGKPTYLSATDLANYLKNMPANQLSQVEIMTQPPAKYDAAGNSGLINLVTKKTGNNGFSGTATTSAIVANYFKNTNSLNFNWREGKANFFGSYGYSWWEGFNDIDNDKSLRADQFTPFNRYVQEFTFGRFSDRSHTFRAGVDISADQRTTLGFAINGNVDNQKFTSASRANIFDSLHNFVQYNDAWSQNSTPQTHLGFNVNLQRKLDEKGGELSADADYIFYHSPGQQYSDNYLYNADNTPSEDPYLLNGQLPSLIDIYSFKSDFKKPLKNNATFEAGIKISYVKTDNDALYELYNSADQAWEPDTAFSNHFIYKENINAAYVNYKKEMGKFSLQAGLRAEQTVSDGDQVVKDTSFHLNALQLFPTVYLNYHQGENSTFGLSYGRRIERPDYQALNPFLSQLDRYTYDKGNPDLQPQFSHNIEASYNYKGQLNITANYSIITDMISEVLITIKQPGDSNYTTYHTSQNIASFENMGLSANYGKQIKKWWTINIFGNIFYNHYKGVIEGQYVDLRHASFVGNLSSQFNFSRGWSAEISGFYNGPGYEGSALLTAGRGMFSLGAEKKIMKDRAAVKLNLRDPLYLMSYTATSDLAQGLTRAHYVWDNRRAILTLVYHFGKTNNSQAQNKTGAGEEQSRVRTASQQ